MRAYLGNSSVLTLLILGCVALTGCLAGQGVRATHQPINEALHYTSKQQMLLNIVRLKYNEPPEFLVVPNVTESLSYSGDSRANFSPFRLTGWSLGASASERPTIQYAPLEDEQFNRRLVSPIPRDVIDLLGATNRSPGQLFRLTVKNINDVDNASSAGGPTPDLAPEFRDFKVAASILDSLHAYRQVEITHISSRDEKAGLDQKRGDGLHKKMPGETGSAPSAGGAANGDSTSGVSAALRKLASEVSGRADRQQDFGEFIHGLTKSEVERIVESLSHADQRKLIVQMIRDEFSESERKPFTKEQFDDLVTEIADGLPESKWQPLLTDLFTEIGADTEPLAKKLFTQIREGMTPPVSEGGGSDQVVLRFAASALEDPNVKLFQEIFKLKPADNEHPYYNIQRADWGQLRRRDEQEKNGDQSEIRLWASPRSFLEVMYFVSQGISIPQEHYEQGLVTVTQNHDGSYFDWSEVTGDLLCVCVSDRKPSDASTAVRYRGYWYYIQDSDVRSKSTFALLMQVYNMAVRSGAVGQVPALTIPL